MNLDVSKRQYLAYWLSLICLTFSTFFVFFNWLLGQTLLVWVNLAMTICYLFAFLLIRNSKSRAGKTLLILSVSAGIFLVSSIVGRSSDNYILYFPVIGGIFLLFGIEERNALLLNLLLPLAALVALEWTDYSLFINYYRSGSTSANAMINLGVGVTAMCLTLYYAQRLSRSAEKAMRESQQSLLAIIENTTNAIWSIDRNHRIITCNSTLKNEFKYGYGIDLEKGVNILQSVPPAEQEVWVDICRRGLSGERFIKEFHYEFPGRVFDVEIAVNPIRDSNGAVTGVSFFSKNVTKRRKVEANLRFHANVLAQVNDAVIGLNNHQQVTFWNRGAERIYGVAQVEALGKSISEIYSVEWLNGMNQSLINKQLDLTGTCQMEVVHILTCGKKVYITTNIQVWHDENGNAIGLVAVNRDITESKKAEDMIREANQKLTALLENAQNIIFAVDREYRYVAFNHQHKEAIKKLYNEDIYLGMSLLQFQSCMDVDRNRIFSHLTRALTGEQFIVVEPFGDPSLIRRYFEHAFTPMIDEQKQVVGVTVFSLDITERIESEEELKRINFELDSFVYRSSHDLRAPLRSILGLISLIRDEENDLQQEYYLKLIEKSVHKLDTFIADMTDFSRNSRQEVKPAVVQFESIIADCADNIRYMEHADRVDLRVYVHGKGVLYSDTQRIGTIFQNLMSNSVKYQRFYADNSYIQFDICYTDEGAQIVYSDNGRGIEPVHLDKIFDMFFRAASDSYGSGLGLYITKQVVKKLNGAIRVESELGQGTRFIIDLPTLKPEVASRMPVLI